MCRAAWDMEINEDKHGIPSSEEWILELMEVNQSGDYKAAEMGRRSELYRRTGSGAAETCALLTSGTAAAAAPASFPSGKRTPSLRSRRSPPAPGARRQARSNHGADDPPLKLKGNLMKILKTPKAAIELVNWRVRPTPLPGVGHERENARRAWASPWWGRCPRPPTLACWRSWRTQASPSTSWRARA